MSKAIPLVVLVHDDHALLEQRRRQIEGKGVQALALDSARLDAAGEQLILFLLQHRPDLVVYDVPSLQSPAWTLLHTITSNGSVLGQRFLVASDDQRVIDLLAEGRSDQFAAPAYPCRPADLLREVLAQVRPPSPNHSHAAV